MNVRTTTVRSAETRCTTCEATILAGEISTVTTHVETRPGRAHVRAKGRSLVIDRRECGECVAKWNRASRIRNACV